MSPFDRQSLPGERANGPGGLTRDVERPLPSNHPHCDFVVPLQLKKTVLRAERVSTQRRRWLVGLSAVPLILLMLMFPLLPESPHYLVINGRTAEAETILRRVRHSPLRPPEVKALVELVADRRHLAETVSRSHECVCVNVWADRAGEQNHPAAGAPTAGRQAASLSPGWRQGGKHSRANVRPGDAADHAAPLAHLLQRGVHLLREATRLSPPLPLSLSPALSVPIPHKFRSPLLTGGEGDGSVAGGGAAGHADPCDGVHVPCGRDGAVQRQNVRRGTVPPHSTAWEFAENTPPSQGRVVG